MSLRALQRRVKRIEEVRKPRPSPFTRWYGSFDAWVEEKVLPDIESEALDGRDMVDVIAALRAWETEGLWAA